MSRTEFVYWALGGRVALALVADHFEGRRSAAAILPGAGRYMAGMGWAHDLLRDPEAYRGAACALWRGIAGSVVEQCGELNAFYEESTRILVGKFESSGASVHEFALESGGDDLRSGGGAHVYCFILSWFLSPHRVRWCDLQRQFIVPDWREVCVGSEKDRAQSLGKVVGALADTNRLVIMRELCRSRSSGRALAPRLGLTPATTAHHLDVLMSAGLVSREAVGSAQVYSADLSAVDTAVREMRSYLSYGPRQK
jgi:DNA-binding transcriptional ArsR family regulator